MTIRLRLLLMVVVVAVALLCGLGFFTLETQRHWQQEEMRTRGESLLRALAVPCAVAMAEHEIERLDDYVGMVSGPVAERLDIAWVAVLDHQGAVLAHTDENQYGRILDDGFYRQAQRSTDALTRYIQREHQSSLMEVAMPVFSGIRWGTLVAAFDLERLQQRLTHGSLWLLLAIAAFALVLAASLYWHLSRIVSRPLRHLSSVAARLAGGDMAVRTTQPQPAEFEQVAQAFNRMAEEVAANRRSLEEKVADRTEQLHLANEKLSKANAELAAAVAQLANLAITDELTGLANLRHFRQRLQDELQRCNRTHSPMALLMLDVDNFKHYNDTHGHLQGDEALRTLAAIMRQSLREIDLAVRYGGEEFCVLLLDTVRADGVPVAERLRQAVAAHDFNPTPNAGSDPLTVSIGVAGFPEDGIAPDDLIGAADQALYAGKKLGKNRVVASHHRSRPAEFIHGPQVHHHSRPFLPTSARKPVA